MAKQLDLPHHYRQQLETLLRRHLPTVEVWAYGSRVNGQGHDGSDLDLVLRSPELQQIPTDSLASFSEALRESAIPFLVEVHDWARLPESFHPEIEREHLVLVAADSRPLDQQNSGMEGEWRETSLGELIELKRGYDLPQRNRSPGPFPLVSSSGVTDYQAVSKVAGPGVVTGRYGTLGKVFFVPEDFWPLNTTLYVRDFKGNDPRFISYFLRSVDFSPYSDKAAVPGLNRNHLHQAQVRFPADVAEQRTIAQILGTLDDKIELNRQLNETLEELARAIFKDWFVDFGPVRAKLEGRDTGLPEQLAELFPDRLVESELGGIPEGWKVGTVGEIADQRRHGARPEQIAPDTPYIALEHMPKRCIALYDWDMATGLASSKFRFERGDILFGKLRPYFHKVGVAPLDGVCSTDIVVVSPKSHDWFGLVLGHTFSAKFVDYTDARATGTRMPRTKWTDMADYKIALPDRELARAFTRQIQPWVDRIVSAIHESHALAAVRDVLLPKLVSGELRMDKEDANDI